jgi:hypothetical protein
MIVTEVIEPKSHNLVTKSNMLIEANYKLGMVEQKIILCLASHIQPHDDDFKTYTLPIKEFNKLLGLKGHPKYKELREITKELMQKPFEVRIDKSVIQVSWLSYVAYNENEGTIDLRFDPFLKPYLLQLKREFTSYKLENVVKLKSAYSIRIYELLKQYEKLHERTLLLTDLRKMLGAEDIYPAYGNFKQRVLLAAQKELQKKTDLNFKIEEIKSGRKVTKIKFIISSIKSNNQPLLEIKSDFEEKVKILGLKLGITITDKVLSNWSDFGEENVINVMQSILGRKDIDNPIGYITFVLKTMSNTDAEVAATSEEETVLNYLISYFSKKKEVLPDWFFDDIAIGEIKNNFNMTTEEAEQQYKSIKAKLYGILERKLPEEKKPLTEEERQKNEEKMEEILRKLRS